MLVFLNSESLRSPNRDRRTGFCGCCRGHWNKAAAHWRNYRQKQSRTPVRIRKDWRLWLQATTKEPWEA